MKGRSKHFLSNSSRRRNEKFILGQDHWLVDFIQFTNTAFLLILRIDSEMQTRALNVEPTIPVRLDGQQL